MRGVNTPGIPTLIDLPITIFQSPITNMPLTLARIFTPRTILIDAVILVAIYFIPALSHVAPFPLYLLDPMRIFMLAGYVLTRQNTNAYLLAITIPLCSALVSGHPPLFKAALISIELAMNILLFVQLLSLTKLHVALTLFISILGSKLIYYGLKFALISFGLVEGDLITTNLWVQLGTVVFITLIFTLSWIKPENEKSKIEIKY